jgi:hypothetical protein
VVGGADVSLLPIPAGIWMLTDSSLVRNTLGSSGIGKEPKKLRGGQHQFGHAPAGAGTSTKVPNVGIHSVDGGVTDRSDC